MNYRRAVTSDIKQLDGLLNKLIDDEKQYDKNLDPILKADCFYKKRIQLNNHIIYVCEVNDTIVGYIYFYLKTINAAFIDALFVSDEYRNQGVATKLINMTLEYLKEHKITSVEISVLSENTIARNLYLKYGFNTFKEVLKLEL